MADPGSSIPPKRRRLRGVAVESEALRHDSQYMFDSVDTAQARAAKHNATMRMRGGAIFAKTARGRDRAKTRIFVV
jgi:hypothetical protein